MSLNQLMTSEVESLLVFGLVFVTGYVVGRVVAKYTNLRRDDDHHNNNQDCNNQDTEDWR